MKYKNRILNEGQMATIYIDYNFEVGVTDNDAAKYRKKYKIKFEEADGNELGHGGAKVTGKKKDIIKFLTGKEYAHTKKDVKEYWPELLRK